MIFRKFCFIFFLAFASENLAQEGPEIFQQIELMLSAGRYREVQDFANQKISQLGAKAGNEELILAWKRVAARAYQREGHLEKALQIWQELAGTPNRITHLRDGLKLIQTQLEMWDLEGAKQWLKALPKPLPQEFKDAQQELSALALLLSGEQGKARLLLNQSSEKSFTGWHNLGRLEFERGDNAKALVALKKAAKIDPDDYYNRLYLAWSHLRLNDLPQATEAFTSLAQSAPTAEVFELLGRLKLREGKFAEARQWSLNALTLDADLAEAQFVLATALKRLGKTNEAQQAFKKFKANHQKQQAGLKEAYRLNQIHQQDPSDPEKALVLGKHHLSDGDVASAERLSWRVLRKHPNHGQARLTLARAYRKVRRFSAAAIQYQIILKTKQGAIYSTARKELQELIQAHAKKRSR